MGSNRARIPSEHWKDLRHRISPSARSFAHERLGIFPSLPLDSVVWYGVYTCSERSDTDGYPLDWTSGTKSRGRRGNGAVLRARGLAGGTAAPLAIVSTPSRWSRVSTLFNAPSCLAFRSKRLLSCCCCAWTLRRPVTRLRGARRRNSRRWSGKWSSYNACGTLCSRWPPSAPDQDRPVPVPCLRRSTSKSRLSRRNETRSEPRRWRHHHTTLLR